MKNQMMCLTTDCAMGYAESVPPFAARRDGVRGETFSIFDQPAGSRPTVIGDRADGIVHAHQAGLAYFDGS